MIGRTGKHRGSWAQVRLTWHSKSFFRHKEAWACLSSRPGNRVYIFEHIGMVRTKQPALLEVRQCRCMVGAGQHGRCMDDDSLACG